MRNTQALPIVQTDILILPYHPAMADLGRRADRCEASVRAHHDYAAPAVDYPPTQK
jgi:hypothetical protein